MDDKCIYNCEVCGQTKDIETETTSVPECCGEPMQKQQVMPACEISATAEHSRFDDLGEPCDDGRGWNENT